MKRAHHRSVLYRCDYPGCKAEHIAPYRDFKLAWASAKAAGWVTAKHDDKWFHFCMWAHRPANDRQFQELIDGKVPGVVHRA